MKTNGWICVLLLAPSIALAQGTSAHKTREQLEIERVLHQRMANCMRKAQDAKLQPGTSEFNQFITGCMRS